MKKLAALESRVRENRLHGLEGGEAKAFPTPIMTLRRARRRAPHASGMTSTPCRPKSSASVVFAKAPAMPSLLAVGVMIRG